MSARPRFALLSLPLALFFALLAATILSPIASATSAQSRKTASGHFSVSGQSPLAFSACKSGQALGKSDIATTTRVCAFSYGKEADQLSRLNYYGYRYYDPLSLQWTQADPLYRVAPDIAYDQPRRMSLYAFSLNNPMRYLDPDGRDSTGIPNLEEMDDISAAFTALQGTPVHSQAERDATAELIVASTYAYNKIIPRGTSVVSHIDGPPGTMTLGTPGESGMTISAEVRVTNEVVASSTVNHELKHEPRTATSSLDFATEEARVSVSDVADLERMEKRFRGTKYHKNIKEHLETKRTQASKRVREREVQKAKKEWEANRHDQAGSGSGI